MSEQKQKKNEAKKKNTTES